MCAAGLGPMPHEVHPAATLLPEHDPDHDRYRSGVDMCPLVPEDEVMPYPCDGCPAN